MRADPPRRRRILARVAVAACAALAGLLLAEGGLRAWLALRGRAWDAGGANERIQALATTMSESVPRLDGGTGEEEYDGRAVHPYIGVDTRKMLRHGEEIAGRHLRGEFDQAFVVAVFGGSVAAQLAGYAQAELRDALAVDPRLAGREIVVVNAGRGSLKQPQQASLLAYCFSLGWKPDAVVEIDGFNEIALALDNLSNDVHPAHPAYSGWAVVAARRSDLGRELPLVAEIHSAAARARALADDALEGGWTHSAVAGTLAERRLRAIQREWTDASERYRALVLGTGGRNPAKGPLFEQRDAEALERIVAVWREASISMAGMCRERGIAYLHVLQPTLHDAGSKPLTEEERATAKFPDLWERSIREHYGRLREEGRALAGRGVAFADLSLVFRDFTGTTYYDGCHFRGEGLALFARRIAEELARVLPAELPPRPRR